PGADASAARFDALEHEAGDDRAAIAASGVTLAALGRWDEAITRLARARVAPTWERQSDLVEVDTWLGVAYAARGDVYDARPYLQEALATLAVWRNGFEGFSYATPIAQRALSRLVEDPARAKHLAELAAAGFARLGPAAERRARR